MTAHTEPFTAADLEELASRGISIDEVGAQLQQLRQPPPPIVLDRPCTIGDGIVQLDAVAQAAFVERGDEAARAGRVVKFVPASGAATRMFKDLIAASQGEAGPSAHAAARQLFEQLERFPFADELRRRSGITGTPASDDEERQLLRTLLEEMAFANRPKGLIPFHRTDSIRTAFDEHLLEGVGYTRDALGICRMHFTVSAEAHAGFEAARAAAGPLVERRAAGAVLDVTFSEQHPSTDTIAIDVAGEPFRNADGRLLFRPAGHGALLRNIQDLRADIVAIKNIDNVLPHEASNEVVRWRQLLVGCLVDLQGEVFAHLAALHRSESEAEIDAALAFARDRFGCSLPETVRGMSARAQWARERLDRPLRICGVVRNEGEPGGAPFWVRGRDGACSIQIVESSQVDTNEPDQARIFRSSTHFNPVDLVCGVRSWQGQQFDLARFVDPDTAFVVRKSADGRELMALERPGLWNGAMAGWNTLCVEVPSATFAPVKTVADLLRPQHQYRP